MLARGRGASQTAAGESSESEGEAARQRVVRRADALGWFLTENGRRVRFFVDTDDWPRVAPGVADALGGLGAGPGAGVAGGLEARPLWPDPRARWRLAARRVRGGCGRSSRWWRCGVRAPLAGAATAGGALAPALAAAVGAAAPFAFVPVAGVRLAGGARGAGGRR